MIEGALSLKLLKDSSLFYKEYEDLATFKGF